MKTYYLVLNNNLELAALEKSFKTKKKGFRVVLLGDDLPTEFKRYIVREKDGDFMYTDESEGWLKSNIVEELGREYIAKAPLPPAALKRAIKRWEDSQARVKAAEAALQRALSMELEAEKGIVRANGPGPLVYQGGTWDPVPRVNKDGKEFVRYQRRANKFHDNKLDTV